MQRLRFSRIAFAGWLVGQVIVSLFIAFSLLRFVLVGIVLGIIWAIVVGTWVFPWLDRRR